VREEQPVPHHGGHVREPLLYLSHQKSKLVSF
jgi:hypothetical protein